MGWLNSLHQISRQNTTVEKYLDHLDSTSKRENPARETSVQIESAYSRSTAAPQRTAREIVNRARHFASKPLSQTSSIQREAMQIDHLLTDMLLQAEGIDLASLLEKK